MSEWQGKTCVVTGAAGGIGAAIAQFSLAQGMKVVAIDVNNDALQSRYADIEPSRMLLQTCDVSDEASVQALAERVFEWSDEVHLLFNNAGIMIDGLSWERSAADWRWTLDVNVMGVVHGVQAFLPRMLAQDSAGRIINASSIGGLLGGAAYMGLYQGSKHLVTAISESLYQELLLKQANVSVSVLCPAEVATDIWNPERLRQVDERSEEGEQFHSLLSAGIARGLAPDELAPLVFEGIAADKFWLLPQPDFKPALQQRCEDILAERNPVSMMAAMLDGDDHASE